MDQVHSTKETISQSSETERSNKGTSKLNIKSDENGILRCYGRLTPATEETDNNPTFLPKKNHFTGLVIKDYHERLFHAGASHVLSYIKSTFWIPHGRTEVRSVLFKSGVCLKYQEESFKMPNISS